MMVLITTEFGTYSIISTMMCETDFSTSVPSCLSMELIDFTKVWHYKPKKVTNPPVNVTSFTHLQILQHGASFLLKLFKMGGGQPGDLLELRGQVRHTAVMHQVGYFGQGKLVIDE
jgi:hypothetical protein